MKCLVYKNGSSVLKHVYFVVVVVVVTVVDILEINHPSTQSERGGSKRCWLFKIYFISIWCYYIGPTNKYWGFLTTYPVSTSHTFWRIFTSCYIFVTFTCLKLRWERYSEWWILICKWVSSLFKGNIGCR